MVMQGSVTVEEKTEPFYTRSLLVVLRKFSFMSRQDYSNPALLYCTCMYVLKMSDVVNAQLVLNQNCVIEICSILPVHESQNILLEVLLLARNKGCTSRRLSMGLILINLKGLSPYYQDLGLIFSQ